MVRPVHVAEIPWLPRLDPLAAARNWLARRRPAEQSLSAEACERSHRDRSLRRGLASSKKVSGQRRVPLRREKCPGGGSSRKAANDPDRNRRRCRHPTRSSSHRYGTRGVRKATSCAQIACERELPAIPRCAAGDDVAIGRLDFNIVGVIPYRGEVRRHLAVVAAECGIKRAVAVVASDSEFRVRAEEVRTARGDDLAVVRKRNVVWRSRARA
jgi:hypothetical protein